MYIELPNLNINSLRKGAIYALEGAIAGLVVQAIFFIPDWGVNKWLFSLVGLLIILASAIATYKEVIRKDNEFIWSFIAITILFVIIGPTL